MLAKVFKVETHSAATQCQVSTPMFKSRITKAIHCTLTLELIGINRLGRGKQIDREAGSLAYVQLSADEEDRVPYQRFFNPSFQNATPLCFFIPISPPH